MGSKCATVGLLVLLGACAAAAQERFHVMVTNDDGIDAPGLAALVEALATDDRYRITVVAPEEQQSVTGHAHVTRRDVPVRPHFSIAGAAAWSADATPASVVRIGLTAILTDDPPGLVVSGINRGENDGLGAWTSGTVAAAREAAMLGVPAVALSLQLDWDDPVPNFAAAARWAKPVVDAVRSSGLPDGVYLNVNIPRDTDLVRGYRLARMGTEPPQTSRFELVLEEDGTRWYRSRWRPPIDGRDGTDVQALKTGWVSIVPLGLDQTDYRALSVIQGLPLTALEAATESVRPEDRLPAVGERVVPPP